MEFWAENKLVSFKCDERAWLDERASRSRPQSNLKYPKPVTFRCGRCNQIKGVENELRNAKRSPNSQPFIKSFQFRTFVSCFNDFCLISSLNCSIPGRIRVFAHPIKNCRDGLGVGLATGILNLNQRPDRFLFWNNKNFCSRMKFKAAGMEKSFPSEIQPQESLQKYFSEVKIISEQEKFACRQHSVGGCARSATCWKLATIKQICSRNLSGHEWQRLSSCCGDRRTRQAAPAYDRSRLFILLTHLASAEWKIACNARKYSDDVLWRRQKVYLCATLSFVCANLRGGDKLKDGWQANRCRHRFCSRRSRV